MIPHSLFWRTALLAFLLMVALEAIVLSTTANFILAPILRVGTEDFAALVLVHARAWSALPRDARQPYAATVVREHRFELSAATAAPNGTLTSLPYTLLLQAHLLQLLKQPVHVYEIDGHYVVDLPLAHDSVRVRFAHSRIGTQPPLTLIVLVAALVLLSLATALWLARRIAQPLRRLSSAAQIVGQGGVPPPIPEQGPKELVQLTRRLNRMAEQVRDLLQARTVLLAGISHDLRTPLARLRLGLELIRNEASSSRLEAMERDIAHMDRLIGQALQFARDTQAGQTHACDISAVIENIVADARRAGAAIEWTRGDAYLIEIDVDAFSRILRNLLDNALRYSNGKSVTVKLSASEAILIVEVADYGPGIAPAVREKLFAPFIRLDARSGTGLGLAIAKQLADRYGWNLKLKDRADGGTLGCICIERLKN